MTDAALPSEIQGFFDEAELLASDLRELNVKFAAIRERAIKKKIDWAQLKALAVARDADAHDATNKGRVAKILEKHTYGSWYAEILHLDSSAKMNNPRAGRSSTLTKGQSAAEHNAPRSAPLAATVGDDRGDPVADTNSNALAVQPSPLRNDSSAAAGMPSVPAAPIRESDEFNRIPEFLMR